MQSVIEKIQDKYKKSHITDIRPGDTVKVHQKIREGNKERIQIFQGLVIRVTRKQSHTSRVTVRRVSGGVGVEKSFLLHSPLVARVEVVKRSKVRRNYLSYMRQRTGKSARLSGVAFDREAINAEPVEEAPAENPTESTNDKSVEAKAATEPEPKAEKEATSASDK